MTKFDKGALVKVTRFTTLARLARVISRYDGDDFTTYVVEFLASGIKGAFDAADISAA